MKELALAVDIGGTGIKLGVVDASGRVLSNEVFLTKNFRGRQRLIQELCRRLTRLKVFYEKKFPGCRWRGAGVGAPGPIDVERGEVIFFPNIPGWKHTPLRDRLRRRLRMPVFLDNDANAMAYGEFLFGAGSGCRDLIALTLGTGVGGGMVLGGRLFHGRAYSAAEIGHISVEQNGPRCGCGSRGCVETYVGNDYFIRDVRRRLRRAGSGSLLKRWVTAEKKTLTPLLVEKAAKQGDRLAREAWERAGERLGTALAGLVNVLNPERIVIGGGLAKAGTLIFGPIRRTIARKSFPIAARFVKVMPARCGTEAGLIGAAALCFSPPLIYR